MKSRCEVQTSKREVLDWYLSKDCSVLLIPLHHSASLLTAAFPRPLHPKAYTVDSSRSQCGSLLYINLFCNFFFQRGVTGRLSNCWVMETSVVTAPPLVSMESRAEDDVFGQPSVSHVQLCLRRRLRTTSTDPLHSGHRLHLLKSLSLVVYYRHQSARTLKPLMDDVNSIDQQHQPKHELCLNPGAASFEEWKLWGVYYLRHQFPTTLPSPQEGHQALKPITEDPSVLIESFCPPGLHLHGCVHVFYNVLGPNLCIMKRCSCRLATMTVSGSLVF